MADSLGSPRRRSSPSTSPSTQAFETSPLELALAGCLGDAAIGFGRQLEAFSLALRRAPAAAFPLRDYSTSSSSSSSTSSSSSSSSSSSALLLSGGASSVGMSFQLQQSPSIVTEYMKRLVEVLTVYKESFLTEHDWQVLADEGAAHAAATMGAPIQQGGEADPAATDGTAPAASPQASPQAPPQAPPPPPRSSVVVSIPFILSSILDPLLRATQDSAKVRKVHC